MNARLNLIITNENLNNGLLQHPLTLSNRMVSTSAWGQQHKVLVVKLHKNRQAFKCIMCVHSKLIVKGIVLLIQSTTKLLVFLVSISLFIYTQVFKLDS